MQNSISQVTSPLPPGFRFHATAEELLMHYLKPRILGHPPDGHNYNMIPEIDVLEFEPWQLPSQFGHMFDGKELYFFCHVKRKYSSGNRSNRATKAGYWKQTGEMPDIFSEEDPDAQIGIRKTLVFHEGRTPNGKRTNWVMHEYLLNPECLGNNHDKNEMLPYAVCRIKHKKDKPKKDKKLMKGHAPMITPYTDTSNVSETPMNQEGDYLSFCGSLHNEVAENQEVVDAQYKQSVEDLMEFFPSLQPLGEVSNYNTIPIYQPLTGAEEGLSSLFGLSHDSDGYGINYGYMPSSYSNPANNSSFDWGDF
ncbi:hypothetical protein BT93_A0136 [Corymbia citriodora subsp. variegata]|nr:hypothetical protein BT93_A0136 [Corymbia citriodora subsp. variegata]